MTTKTCTKCGETKPADRFSKDRRSADGLQRRCKECYRAYREANRGRIAERARTYYEVHQEQIAEHQRAYREANQERIAAQKRAHYEANRDKISARQRTYNEANRDKMLARQRAYREANRDEIAAQQRAYREANRDEIAAQKRAEYALIGSPGTERARAITSRYATRNGEPWTPEEDRYLLTGTGTNLDKALQLSRTYSAVNVRAQRLRQENAA